MQPTLLALIICFSAAALEGALAGRDVRQRLAQLRMPPYSPPFSLWLVIGFLYYAICFVVLRHLLGSASFTPGRLSALALLFLILLTNALWSVVFFRWRDLRVSFLLFIPYPLVVGVLVWLLLTLYPLGAALFTCYCLYLVYAAWWSYQLCRLNRPAA